MNFGLVHHRTCCDSGVCFRSSRRHQNVDRISCKYSGDAYYMSAAGGSGNTDAASPCLASMWIVVVGTIRHYPPRGGMHGLATAPRRPTSREPRAAPRRQYPTYYMLFAWRLGTSQALVF